MEAIKTYQANLQKSEERIVEINKKRNLFTVYRIILFFGSIFTFYILFSISYYLSVFSFLVFIVLFVYIVIADNKLKRKLKFINIIKQSNTNEIKLLNRDYSVFNPGKEYISNEHPFTSDLDIFGNKSIFQYINRAKSKKGRDILANFFQKPLEVKNVKKNQEAIKELANEVNWRQELHASIEVSEIDDKKTGLIYQWLESDSGFIKNRALKSLLVAMPTLVVFSIILNFFSLPIGFMVVILFFNFWISFLNTQKVNKIHNQVANNVTLFESYADVLRHVENKNFDSQLLQNLKDQIVVSGESASGRIKKLSAILAKLDYRLNLLVGIPLNLLFLWDLQYVFKLERWKEKNKNFVKTWFNTIGQYEALSSLSGFSFNNPEYIFPHHDNKKEFILNARDMGHPLIPKESRIVNDFDINGTSNIVLITGSNMSGKTTFLRTIGVNQVLACVGAPVCASSYSFSSWSLYTSMRISDSLAENTSSFYAELKRLKAIIDTAKNNEKAILLLDEILRGTNSNDRHIGSKALIKQLIKYNAVGILATHDLNLSEMEKDYPQNISNYNFDVQIDGEELFFDYKLHHGICKSLNASILMRKMGIDLD